MITRFIFQATVPEGIVACASWGHWLYSALMEFLPQEVAEAYHQQGMTPFSQYLLPGKEKNSATWVVNLLTEEVETLLVPTLKKCTSIFLRELSCPMALRMEQEEYIAQPEVLLDRAAAMDDRSCHSVRFLTPTSFKHNGRYQIFPEIHSILWSLVQKWNQVAPDYALTDQDALRLLEERLWIRDYRLQSCRFELKGQKVPGFVGSVWIQNRLPASLIEIWRILIVFSQYSGVGMKTALGMGGISLLLYHRSIM